MKKLVCAVLLLLTPVRLFSDTKANLSAEDYNYLLGIATDTWACIDYLTVPNTGLPLDSSNNSNDFTSVSNIGIYAAAVSVAVEMKFIERKDGIARITKLLNSYDKFPVWNGFTQSWHDVRSLKPSTNDPWISILDSGNLAAGFIITRQEFPELGKRISKILSAMDWSKVYNPSQKLLIGGYNMKMAQLNKAWLLSQMGSDARAAYIIAIGAESIPPDSWGRLRKTREHKYSMSYYQPGWQGGGLFMQFLDTCFFDLRYTEMWKSAASFAYAEQFHAKLINSPVWGWSACDSPDDGYLGVNNIRDYVVTPHSSVLAISMFPEEVVANLKKLEEIGARANYAVGKTEYVFGFRDSIDVIKNKPTDTYLILDQGMLFLSLCNYLSDGKIWELSNKDPIIQNARRLLSDLNQDRPGFDDFMSMLYVESIHISVKFVDSKKDFKAGEEFKGRISIICDDVDIAGKYKISWKLFEKNSGKMVKSGSFVEQVSEGSAKTVEIFKSKLAEGSYLLQAIITDKDGTKLSSDNYEFTAVDYIDLAGPWKFKIGDDILWKEQDYDDSTWVTIKVPAKWENEGYSGYDGYAWYRLSVQIPGNLENKWSKGDIYLSIGGIDDADQAYFYGDPIGETAFPPNFKEGKWNKARNYLISADQIDFGHKNVIAVRVFDNGQDGGIWQGPVRIAHKPAVSDVKFTPPQWK